MNAITGRRNRSTTAEDIRDHGAVGDARRCTDFVTNGTTTVTSATAAFTTADVGKRIVIKGAGTAGAPLSTTIASRNSSSSVVLSVAASNSASGQEGWIGTDSTTAIANAITAALTKSRRVFVPDGNFLTDTITTITRDFELFGGGIQSCLVSRDGDDIILVTGVNECVNLVIHSMRLRGTGPEQSRVGGRGVYVHGNGLAANRAHFYDLFVTDMGGSGIAFGEVMDDFSGSTEGETVYGSIFENVRVERCGDHFMFFRATGLGTQFINCHFFRFPKWVSPTGGPIQAADAGGSVLAANATDYDTRFYALCILAGNQVRITGMNSDGHYSYAGPPAGDEPQDGADVGGAGNRAGWLFMGNASFILEGGQCEAWAGVGLKVAQSRGIIRDMTFSASVHAGDASSYPSIAVYIQDSNAGATQGIEISEIRVDEATAGWSEDEWLHCKYGASFTIHNCRPDHVGTFYLIDSGQRVVSHVRGALDGSYNSILHANRFRIDRLLTNSSAAGSSLGSVTKKLQVYDENGSSLGFIPIYDAIT